MSSVSSATSGSSSALPQTDKRVCAVCEKTAVKMSVCSKCRFTSYCGTDCQRTDWPSHKLKCANLFAKKVSSKTEEMTRNLSNIHIAKRKEDEKFNQLQSNPNVADPIKEVEVIVSSQKEQLTQMLKTRRDAEKLLGRLQSNPTTSKESIADMQDSIQELTTRINTLTSVYEGNKRALEQARALSKR
ncbi:MAG: zinc finger MYND domain-containing protein [Verrucomicrobia bacterium]|nr:zinc finger MYND domain-containing protein [Verrucomicrobiota bacterium]